MKTRIHRTARPAAALAFMAVLFCACAPAALCASKPKYKIKIGSYVTPQSVWGKTVQKTIDSISKRTNGEVQLIHLHSGMLGSAQNMLEQVMLGGIQGAGIPSSNLANLVPEVHIIEMPFLFRDRKEAYYLLDKVIAPMLQPRLEARGLKTSAFMEAGFMDIVSSRFIKKPAELKKVKIGSWESPVHVAFWKAQGANPNPIPATEVFRAYTSGQVDTGANGPNALMAWDSLFGTAIDRRKIFITNIDFSYQSGVMVINKKYWDSLPANYRKIIQEELDALTGKIRDGLTKAEPKSVKTLESRGYNFYNPTAAEKKAFVTNSAKVYKEFEGIVGKKFLDKVLSEREKYRKANKK
jgi:TRAP-type C4-dicarboxylate transport system substrate-binding protein